MRRPSTRSLLGTAAAMLLAACADAPSSPATGGPDLGKTTATALYQLEFVIERDGTTPYPDGNMPGPVEGEIRSGLFPTGGIALNTTDPWKSVKAAGALVTLTSPTHGDRSLGKCRDFPLDTKVEWELEKALPLSFEGSWMMNVSTQRDRNGNISLYMDGARVGGAEFGSIPSVGTTGPAVESKAGDGSFKLTFTNARLGFGSKSSPDGRLLLESLPGYESACVNFTLVARRMSTQTP